MSNYFVTINAGGRGERWHETAPKDTGSKEIQLIADEPIICRTIRLLAQHNIIPTIVSHKLDVLAAVQQSHCPHCPCATTPRPYTTQHAWAMRDQWQQYNIVLLGDVIFNPGTLDTIIKTATDTPLQWYGRNNEMFAFSWQPSTLVSGLFQRTLTVMPRRSDTHYRRYSGMYEIYTKHKYVTKHTHQMRIETPDDGTVDIDDWDRYQKALAVWG